MAQQRGLRGQLDLFDWQPPPPLDCRSAIIAAIATASAAQVGRRLGLTRHSVLSHVDRARRAGLVVQTRPWGRREPEAAPLPSLLPFPAPTVRPPVVGTPMPILREDLVPIVAIAAAAGPVTLMTVGPRQCRAIVEGDDVCCGEPVEGRGSWCAAHRAAFRSPAKLRPIILREIDL